MTKESVNHQITHLKAFGLPDIIGGPWYTFQKPGEVSPVGPIPADLPCVVAKSHTGSVLPRLRSPMRGIMGWALGAVFGHV